MLDAYMKQPSLLYHGEVRPVHLSENGFNSKDYSAKELEDQAAGMAMAWKRSPRYPPSSRGNTTTGSTIVTRAASGSACENSRMRPAIRSAGSLSGISIRRSEPWRRTRSPHHTSRPLAFRHGRKSFIGSQSIDWWGGAQMSITRQPLVHDHRATGKPS